MKKLILSVVLVNLLAGCSYFKPKKSTAKAEDTPVATAPAPAGEQKDTGSAVQADVNAQTLASDTADSTAAAEHTPAPIEQADKAAVIEQPSDNAAVIEQPKRSVYFPFDVDSIQDADKLVVQAHGAYLGEHPEQKVRTEGHADERGSSEYNLALGQRRANNTKKALVLSGAKTKQVDAISFGEEKPQSSGHDENSWAQNRRVDISY